MAYTLEMKNQSWVENTENEVDFIIKRKPLKTSVFRGSKTLELKGNENILD